MKPLDKALLEMQALRNPRMAASVMGKTPAPDPYYGHPSQVEPGLEAVSPEDFVPNPKSVVAALKALGPAAMLGMVGKKTPRKMTEFEQRHMIAQKNAALPVEQGGLGLSPNNTAMDRAKALGYEKGWGHGSPDPTITQLRSSELGSEGRGAYATDYLPETGMYAGSKDGATVYPLMVNRSKTIETPAGIGTYSALDAFSDKSLSEALSARGLDSITSAQPSTPEWLIKAGGLDMPPRRHFNSENMANFRSPFAAFDPMRRHEADMLGFANPSLLGSIAAGGGGAMAYDAMQSGESEDLLTRLGRLLKERSVGQ